MGFMSYHPRVFNKLRAEIDAAFDEIPSWEDLTFDKVNSLKYLDCFLKEVLRMVPIAPATVREVGTDGEVVGGYPVPKGTWLLVATYAMHHSEEVWTDAQKFWPERFEQETIDREEKEGKKRHSYAHLGFSAGQCLFVQNSMSRFSRIFKPPSPHECCQTHQCI